VFPHRRTAASQTDREFAVAPAYDYVEYAAERMHAPEGHHIPTIRQARGDIERTQARRADAKQAFRYDSTVERTLGR